MSGDELNKTSGTRDKDLAGIVELPEDYPSFDANFKIILIGNSGVGKSCLTYKAIKNEFCTNYNATIGFEFFTLNLKINNKVIRLQIWDTCGMEIYRSLITNFYRSTSLAILVYAINDDKSFGDIDKWIKELKEYNSPNSKLFLIGNKCDLDEQRRISYERGKKFANQLEVDYFLETSAKTGFNAKKMFYKAATILYNENKDNLSRSSTANSFNNSGYSGYKKLKNENKPKRNLKNDGCGC